MRRIPGEGYVWPSPLTPLTLAVQECGEQAPSGLGSFPHVVRNPPAWELVLRGLPKVAPLKCSHPTGLVTESSLGGGEPHPTSGYYFALLIPANKNCLH